MVNSKNSLELNYKKDTFKKSIYSRPQVDGIVKKSVCPIDGENFSKKKNVPENFLHSEKAIETKVEKVPAVIAETVPEIGTKAEIENSSIDDSKRMFFKVAGVAGLGLAASALFPKSSEAYVSGSTPTSNVVGIKSIDNSRINPATVEGQGVTKLSTTLSSSGAVHTPDSGKKIRVYASRFSLTADATSVSFRFTS